MLVRSSSIGGSGAPLARPGGARGGGGVKSDQLEFSAILGRQDTGVAAGRPGAAVSAEEKARTAAQEFVAIALVQPILTEAREESMAAEPFAASGAERQFRALQDAAFAQRITRAAHFPLVDRLARDLLRK
ncbi:MAG: hypothetical protein IT435_14005 [Phycisphaerales bacterium]|nr:hypothetical protein [Phycisphaerales bacterium]